MSQSPADRKPFPVHRQLRSCRDIFQTRRDIGTKAGPGGDGTHALTYHPGHLAGRSTEGAHRMDAGTQFTHQHVQSGLQ